MHDHVKFLFSIVLLGLVDARYNFLFVDIGQAGASNDAGIYNRSKLNKMREDGLLNLPSSHMVINSTSTFTFSATMPSHRLRRFSSLIRTILKKIIKPSTIIVTQELVASWNAPSGSSVIASQ